MAVNVSFASCCCSSGGHMYCSTYRQPCTLRLTLHNTATSSSSKLHKPAMLVVLSSRSTFSKTSTLILHLSPGCTAQLLYFLRRRDLWKAQRLVTVVEKTELRQEYRLKSVKRTQEGGKDKEFKTAKHKKTKLRNEYSKTMDEKVDKKSGKTRLKMELIGMWPDWHSVQTNSSPALYMWACFTVIVTWFFSYLLLHCSLFRAITAVGNIWFRIDMGLFGLASMFSKRAQESTEQ